MIKNENRRVAAAALGRQLIELALSHKIPSVGDQVAADGLIAPGQHVGRQIGLALICASKDAGLNYHSILDGFGLAFGELLKDGEPDGTSTETLIGAISDGFAQAASHAAGVKFRDPAGYCARCGGER